MCVLIDINGCLIQISDVSYTGFVKKDETVNQSINQSNRLPYAAI
jgi:hypothetical protein